MDLHDVFAAADIRQAHVHLTVETARTQQRFVQYVGAVGCRDHDHAGVRLETVHFHEHLVQRLFAFVVTAAHAGAAMTAHSIDFVDKHDTRCVLLGLLEHVAHPSRTHTDEHLNEVRTRDAEERYLRFASNGARQQRLTRTRRPDQQYAARNTPTQLLE